MHLLAAAKVLSISTMSQLYQASHKKTTENYLSPGLTSDEVVKINSGPAEPEYAMLLQTLQIHINWLLTKPTNLDLHCLSFSM